MTYIFRRRRTKGMTRLSYIIRTKKNRTRCSCVAEEIHPRPFNALAIRSGHRNRVDDAAGAADHFERNRT